MGKFEKKVREAFGRIPLLQVTIPTEGEAKSMAKRMDWVADASEGLRVVVAEDRRGQARLFNQHIRTELERTCREVCDLAATIPASDDALTKKAASLEAEYAESLKRVQAKLATAELELRARTDELNRTNALLSEAAIEEGRLKGVLDKAEADNKLLRDELAIAESDREGLTQNVEALSRESGLVRSLLKESQAVTKSGAKHLREANAKVKLLQDELTNANGEIKRLNALLDIERLKSLAHQGPVTKIDLGYLTEAAKDSEALLAKKVKKVREHWQAPEAPEPYAAAIKTAPVILASAMLHMEERAKQYDAPAGERSMAATVELFNSLTGRNLTEVEGWKFMVLLKLVRAESAKGKALQDSYEDAVAYMALAGEAALK